MKNRLFAVALLATLTCGTLMAQKVTIDGVIYKIKKGEAYVYGGTYKDDVVNIQSSISYKGQEYPVTSIGSEAFSGDDKIRYVSIPNSIKVLEPFAFNGCLNLQELVVPDTPMQTNLRNTIVGSQHSKPFYKSKSIIKVRSQNGSFPSYMLSILPEDCLFMYAYRNGSLNQQIQVQTIPQKSVVSNTPSSQKAPSSDVDVNIPSNAQGNDNTFAVIIANENYAEEVNVDYALNDGEMFKEYCHKVLGLPEDNVHIRKDATLNNIKAEISWMQQVAKAYNNKARFIVFYAGHGIPDESTKMAYLLPVDGKGTMVDTGYSLASLYATLGSMPAERVTVFMDACFSGSKRGEGMLASARGVAIKAKTQVPKGKMIVLSAAQGDETAYPYKEKQHGLFTYFLLKKLKETKGNVTYGELSSYIKEQVSRKSIVSNGKSQTPTVTPSQNVAATWKTMKLK